MTLPAQAIVERLREPEFVTTDTGRFAADLISRLTADNEALQNDVRIGCANIDREIAARQTAEARAIALEADVERLQARLESAAALLDVLAEHAKKHNDTTTWSMAVVMSETLRAALGGSDHG